MIFAKFTAGYFEEYRAWFSDPIIRQHLGEEVTEEWLGFVLSDDTGQQLCVLVDNQLNAVIGVVFPTQQFPAYVISDIAIKPDLRGSGIGRQVIENLLAKFELADNECWQRLRLKKTQLRLHFSKRSTGSLNLPRLTKTD